VTVDSDIVTTDSGRGTKSVTIDRNGWSRCAGMTGHDIPEWAVTMGRNTHLLRAGDISAIVALQKTIVAEMVVAGLILLSTAALTTVTGPPVLG
jgi:hypothetical protein